MTVGRRNTLFVQVALFCGAVLLGWAVRQVLPLWQTRPSAPVPPSAAPALDKTVRGDGLEASLVRVDAWLDDLVEADAARLHEMASNFLAEENFDEPKWTTLFSCWFQESPRDAWQFAQQHRSLSFIALEQWARHDPTAARAALGTPTPQQYLRLIQGTLDGDVEVAFGFMEEALAAGVDLVPDPFRISGVSVWFKMDRIADLARNNPGAAVAWVERFEEPDLLGPVLCGWFELNPANARSWLAQRPDRERVLREAGWFMARSRESYRPEAMDFVLSLLEPGNNKIEMVQEAFESLAYADPDLAVREATRILPDPSLRAEAIGKIADIVARTDFFKAWEILGELDGSVLGIRRVRVPAIEVSEEGTTKTLHPPYHYQSDLISMRGLVSPAEIKSRMLADLIMVDKEQALSFMNELPPEQFRQVCGDCLERWAWHDPREAAGWLAAKLGDAGDTDDVLDWLWDSSVPDESRLEFIAGLPAGSVRIALAADAAGKLARQDPLAAMEFARRAGAQSNGAEEVYDTWASSNPAAALEHLATDSAASPGAWRSVVGRAFGKMPEETSRVVASLPAGNTRDAAVSAIVVETVTAPDPIPAAEWAMDIGDESMRRKAVESLLDRTAMDLKLARDAEVVEALRGMISTTPGIAEAEKNRWLERINLELAIP